MSDLQTQSPAFQQALRQSERLRIYLLLALLAFILVLRGSRTILAPTQDNLATLYMYLVLIGVLAAFEFTTLYALRRAIRDTKPLPGVYWFLNIFIEFLLPAISISGAASSVILPEYRALANPAFLIYFLLLMLTILRLRPPLSILCGFFASGSYLAAAYHLGWRPLLHSMENSLFSPQKNVVTYGVSLIVVGFTAAVVAREFRAQVEAALREAETRRQMEHMQHDLEVARSIQQSLLPHSMPQVAGWDIAAWNQPADQTGGDYYDWQPLPNGKFVTALADVTGHGIGPAMLASVCRAYARTNFRNQDSFVKAMEEINSAVSADVREGRFITFVAAIFGPDSSTVELLSAGHAPLFLYRRKDDSFTLMEAHALPLGISDAFLSDPPHTLEMASGDLLLLATDGFFEWENAREEQFGHDRLGQTIRAARDNSAAEMISKLHQDVLRFANGTKQMDDLTAIVLKRR
ncbi:MAG TPA: PP2C family protein-serine/threonine phosphatase [Candidatus Limnocylindrales bacterium]|nr:PP2C family protein-serine/threonine phosphatase [Candidatus Limnocylindrales bacterium]